MLIMSTSMMVFKHLYSEIWKIVITLWRKSIIIRSESVARLVSGINWKKGVGFPTALAMGRETGRQGHVGAEFWE